MKQAMNISAGVFLGISMISLCIGGFTFNEKSKFESELNKRDPITKQVNQDSGWDRMYNIPRLEAYQSYINNALIIGGGSAALAVVLAVAGKNKDKAKE
jgi:hypothetical protein